MFGDVAAMVATGLYMHSLTPEERATHIHKQKMARILDKENNMKDRLARRRHAIWWKWTARLSIGALALLAIPLFLALLNQCWLLVLN